MLEHFIQPNKLLLTWQAVDKAAGRGQGERFVVGELYQNGQGLVLHYYNNEDVRRATTEHNFKGLTALPFEADKKIRENVEAIFSKRLADTKRPDYADYLRSYRIPPERANELSLMQILAYTGGKIAGDGFALTYVFDGTVPPYDYTFEIAGFRHCEGMELTPITKLHGVHVRFEYEPENERDHAAVAIYFDDVKLGYVPRGINVAIAHQIENHDVNAHVTRINGTKERPIVTILVQVR